MTVSTLMPSSWAMKGSVEVALMAIPSLVLLMNQYRQIISRNEETIMVSWSHVNDTPASRIVRAANICGKILSRGPWRS